MNLIIETNFNLGRLIVVNDQNCFIEMDEDYCYFYNKYTDSLIGKMTIEEYTKQTDIIL